MKFHCPRTSLIRLARGSILQALLFLFSMQRAMRTQWVQLKPLDIEPRALFSIFLILPSVKLHFSFYSFLFLSPLFFLPNETYLQNPMSLVHRKRRYCLTKLASFLIFDLIFSRYAHYVCSLCDSLGFEVLFFWCLMCFSLPIYAMLCSGKAEDRGRVPSHAPLVPHWT